MSPLCKRILFFKPSTLKRLGLEGGEREYPITLDLKIFKKIISHDPLKPVQPVIKTFLFFQNFVFNNIRS